MPTRDLFAVANLFVESMLRLSLVLMRFGVAGGVDFDAWPCWWAPVQGCL